MKLVYVLMLHYFNAGILFFHSNDIKDEPPLFYIFTDKLTRFND